MRLSNCVSYVLAAALLLPVGLFAADHNCNPGAPTPESYTHDFAKEANQLLSTMRFQASAVQRDSEGLANLVRYDQVDWHLSSGRLNRIRSHVNAMGKTLCRLDEIRSAVLPWQRKEIDRIRPALVELADSTTSAIKLLNRHEDTLWATNFPKDVSYIRMEAARVRNSAMRQVEYAKTQSAPGSSSTSSGM